MINSHVSISATEERVGPASDAALPNEEGGDLSWFSSRWLGDLQRNSRMTPFRYQSWGGRWICCPSMAFLDSGCSVVICNADLVSRRRQVRVLLNGKTTVR